MTQGKVIRISNPIFTRLQAIAEPLTDTSASVIEKLLDFYEQHQNNATKLVTNKKVKPLSNIRELNPENPPKLAHSKVTKVILNNLHLTNPGWNEIIEEIHIIAMNKINSREKSYDKLILVTSFNITDGEYTQKGYKFIQKLNISIQNVSSDHAWKGILKMVKTLDISVTIYLTLNDKEGASFPGEECLLSWSPD
ncbi:MAG: T4SS efffector SepA family protein [Planktothrix sp.]